MVNLLKRNHDILMEKYAIFKARNESLEKVGVEKDSIYNDLKIEYDKCSNSLFKIQKQAEDFKSSKEIFEAKLKKAEENIKNKDEQIKTLKVQKDKFEG